MAFLGAYAWPILDPRLSPAAASFCLVVQWVAWAAFAGDYLMRLRLAPRKWLFVRKNLLDLAVIALPLLRPLRLLRLVVLLRIFNRSATLGLRGRVSGYVAGGAVLLALVAALAVLDAERDNPDANITSIGDALWWACTTMSTVGYGDRYPTTTLGRLVAVGLMVSGIALNRDPGLLAERSGARRGRREERRPGRRGRAAPGADRGTHADAWGAVRSRGRARSAAGSGRLETQPG